MTRPIPIFKFVFAAYYATSETAEGEVPRFVEMSKRGARAIFSRLALVVDNKGDPKPPMGAPRGARARECKID